MANKEHLKILKQGVGVWNQWRKQNPEIKPDLGPADLSEVTLSVASPIPAKLTKANLSGANLNRAEDLTAKQLITTINWQEAILDSSLKNQAEVYQNFLRLMRR